MSRVIILGATGVSRSPRAAPGARRRPRRHGVRPHAVQAAARSPGTSVGAHGRPQRARAARLVRGQDALINCAGHVADGETFVALVDRLVTCVDSLPAAEQPVCWFLAGAALLDIDSSGRRGVDLPEVKSTYWPHRVNFERLSRSRLDWRLLCPGPMVDEPALGLDRLRISLDALPVEIPAVARALPDSLLLPVFASLIPQMIVPYADAAALMLANLDRGNAMSRHRVGLALPVGMRGRKPQ